MTLGLLTILLYYNLTCTLECYQWHSDILYVFSLHGNLVSKSLLNKIERRIVFKANKVTITRNSDFISYE